MKTDHGTIEMRTSIVLFVIFIGFASLIYHDVGSSYWESIGPQWDRMFNPVNYGK
jgi:hypothetical protein